MSAGRVAYEARFADSTHGVVLWDDLPSGVRSAWARVEEACAALLQSDATARQRGENLDGSVRRETREHGAKPDAGWKLVPVSLDQAMWNAGRDAIYENGKTSGERTINCWRAMLDAAPPAPPREDAKAGGSVEAALQAALIAIAEGYHVTAKDDRYILVENPKFEQDNGEDPYLRVDVAALSSPKVVHPLGATGGGSVEQSTEADCARKEGFIVDSHCYPWVAYKGARFNPTEWKYIRTDDECALSPRDGGQATGAEPDNAALADELSGWCTSSAMDQTIPNEFLQRIETTLRTSAPLAKPSEARLVYLEDHHDLTEKAIGLARYYLLKAWPEEAKRHLDACAAKLADIDPVTAALQAATVAPPREAEPRPVDGAQVAFDAQSDDPAPGDWNDACRHIAELLRAPGEPRPVEQCAECGGTGRSFDRVDGEITCPECGYPPSPVEQTGSGGAEIERLTLLVEQWKGTAEAEAEAFQEARKEADTFYADLARVTAEIAFLDGWSVINMPPADRASPDGNGVPHAIKLLTALKAEVDRNLAWANEVIIPRCERAEAEVARLTEAAAAGRDLKEIANSKALSDVLYDGDRNRDQAWREEIVALCLAAAGSDVAGLRAALQPFADFIENTDPTWSDDRRIATLNYNFDKLKLGLFRRAHAALAASPDAGAGRTRGGMEGGR